MFGFLSDKLSGVLGFLKGKSRLTEKNLSQAFEQIENALLEADVPFEVVESFLKRIREKAVGQEITSKVNPGDLLIKIVHDEILVFLSGDASGQKAPTFPIPSVIMFMGLQGSGKTTTIAKLARWITKSAEKRGKKRRILVASVDFYRPAAREQLHILADQIGVTYYEAQADDPVAAAREIYDYFKKHTFEHLILDTAGRFHVDENLMNELCQLKNLIKPAVKIIVLDAMTGQESLRVAQSFSDQVGFDAAILTKFDSDTRGGAAFAFRYVLAKPIQFIGTGEKVDDLEPFIPERMAQRILGMGDLSTLFETLDEALAPKAKEQEKAAKRFLSGSFDLQDFADQMKMVQSIGSLQKIARYLPGGQSVSDDMLQKGQEEMKSFQAIIRSMTPKERVFPRLLNTSRRARIARGSGTRPDQINSMLSRFEKSREMFKMMNKSGKTRRFW